MTGRGVVTWTPDLDFTDQTMVYASYSRGYKAGGANPPRPEGEFTSGLRSAAHPDTFDPEFVNAYELGTKNTLLDGDLVLNADAFYYDYKGYQISQIVDRTSININVDAHIYGAELQAAEGRVHVALDLGGNRRVAGPARHLEVRQWGQERLGDDLLDAL